MMTRSQFIELNGRSFREKKLEFFDEVLADIEEMAKNDVWRIGGLRRRPEFELSLKCPTYLLREVKNLIETIGYSVLVKESELSNMVRIFVLDPIQTTSEEEFNKWVK